MFLPKYFRISFDLLLNKQDVIKRKYRRKILHVTNGGCGWPEVYIDDSQNTSLNHAFECINHNSEQYIFSDNENLSERVWHNIEYTQLPIPDTSLVELTIKTNGTTLHKVIYNDAKQYENMQVYYGYALNDNNESTIPDGFIRNFRIEEYNQSELIIINFKFF